MCSLPVTSHVCLGESSACQCVTWRWTYRITPMPFRRCTVGLYVGLLVMRGVDLQSVVPPSLAGSGHLDAAFTTAVSDFSVFVLYPGEQRTAVGTIDREAAPVVHGESPLLRPFPISTGFLNTCSGHRPKAYSRTQTNPQTPCRYTE